MPFKIARKHIMNAIEAALSKSGPVEFDHKSYIIEATPYRIPGRKGNSGVRVTWREV